MIQLGDKMTLGTIFEDNARKFRDEPALVFETVRRTHGELYRNGCRLAASLEALGMRKQDRMAVLSMNNVAFVEAYVAGWTAGYVVATVNFRLALPEILWILGDISPKVVFLESQYASMIEAMRAAVPSITDFVVMDGSYEGAHEFEKLIADAPSDEPSTRASEDDVASLIYTSGTTGKPKGCILGQRENAFNTMLLQPSMGSLPGDRFLCVMPLFHIGAMAIALGVLANGGTAVIQKQFDPAEVVVALHEHRITHALFAPTMVQMVLQQPGVASKPYPDLRMILYSAAPMPSNVLRQGLSVLGPVFVQLMGSSEGSAMTWLPISMHRPDGTPAEQRRLLSIGTPFRGVAIRIVDDNGHDCAPEETGEVVLRSPVMFRGYWNNSGATLESIRDGWFYTGDMGLLDRDGYIYLVDRKKDMIITGGENVYSREVEEALLAHKAVAEVAVIGCPDETWGEIVCAVVVRASGAEVTEQELIDHSRTQIASYKKPRRIVFAEELPRLISGKIDKKALRAAYASEAG